MSGLIRNKSYILNTSGCTLIETGGKTNFLSAPPGGIRHYKVEGNEFILDYFTMAGAFQLKEADIEMKIAYGDNIITIKRRLTHLFSGCQFANNSIFK